jgi:imidazoleglycerol phosphate synthase cyclase subunit
MLTARIIPCLDVSHGRVVKGIRFQGLRDAGDPAERALLYEAQGADEIVILDVSATPEGRGNQVETVRRVRAGLGIPLTVGGGIRTAEDAQALLEAGADKVSVNTAAVERPELLSQIAERFGRQCTVLAIDAAQRGAGFEVLVKGGSRPGSSRTSCALCLSASARGAIRAMRPSRMPRPCSCRTTPAGSTGTSQVGSRRRSRGASGMPRASCEYPRG